VHEQNGLPTNGGPPLDRPARVTADRSRRPFPSAFRASAVAIARPRSAEVATVTGVGAVEVDVDAKTVHVEGEPAEDAVLAAIEEAGYQVANVG
jgi:Heavy-metal-associated domain